jgi:hypothetical protein
MEQRRDSDLLQYVVQRVERAVVRLEGLQAGVELEPAHAMLGGQAAGLLDGRRAAVRVDRSERNQDVVVRCRPLGDLLT